MNRRTFVLAGASALTLTGMAGCVDDILAGEAGGDSQEFQATVDPSSDCIIYHEVEMVQSNPSSTDAPVTLDSTMRNDHDETINYNRGGAAGLHYDAGDNGITMYQEEWVEYEYDDETECWTLTEPPVADDRNEGTLEPEEEQTTRFVLICTSSDHRDISDELQFEYRYHSSTGPLDEEASTDEIAGCDIVLTLER